MWKAAIAEVDITPPFGVWLTGYVSRTKPSEGIHDQLYARALVLENGKGERAALLSLDLIGLTTKQVNQIRQLVRQWTGIPPQHLLINCSHTHSAPAVGELVEPWMGIADEIYLDIVVRQSATAVKLATNELVNVKLSVGVGPCVIGINRRVRQKQKNSGYDIYVGVDTSVNVIAVESGKHYLFAIVFIYGCHPVTLGEDNYLVSADFVKYSCETLKFFRCSHAMFLQGCGGNINPNRRGDIDTAKRVGEAIAGSVIHALAFTEPIENEAIYGIAKTIELPVLPPPSAKWLESWRKEQLDLATELEQQEGNHGEARWRRCEAEWAEKLLKAMNEKKLPTHEPINLQVLRIGDIAFAAMGIEPFSEIGLTIREQFPLLKRVIPLGCTNGCIGYLPTAVAYDEGGYEVETAFKFYGRLLMHSLKSEQIVINWLLDQLKRAYS